MSGYRKILPLTEFKADIDACLSRLREDGQPLVVTRHGRGLFVVQAPDAYEHLERLATVTQHQFQLQDALEEDDFGPPTKQTKP